MLKSLSSVMMRALQGRYSSSDSQPNRVVMATGLVLCFSLAIGLVSACGATPTVAPSAPTDTSAPTDIPTTWAATATTKPVDTPVPAPTDTRAPTEPPKTATPISASPPLTTELKATVVAGLPPTPTPESGDEATWGDIELLPLDVGEGGSPLWAAFSVGMGFYDLDHGPFIAVYTHQDGVWKELDRVVLSGCAEYVDADSLMQVSVEPSRIWLEMQTYAGVHSGCYDLLSFDGQELRLEASGFNSSPGAGNLADLDGDGIPEVVLNLTENYVFCYACGVRLPFVSIMRWDGEQMMVGVDLEHLPDSASEELRDLNDRAVDLALAQRWKDAQEVMAQVLVLEIQDPELAGTVTWNAILIDQIASARAEEIQFSSYPLLSHIFYGDYDAALDIMRPYSPEEIWQSDTPLVMGTEAEGWEDALGEWTSWATNLALELEPDLASAHFLKAWATYLNAPGDPSVMADVTRAAELIPDEPLFSESLAYLEAQIAPPPTAVPPPTDTPPPTKEPTATPQPLATNTPQPTATDTPPSSMDEGWTIRNLLVGPGQPARLYAFMSEPWADSLPPERTRFEISDDNGQTWRPFPGGLPPEGCVRSINMDYAAQDALFASTCRGLYHWTGSEWAFLSPEETGMVAVVYGQPNTMWATGPWGSGGVLRSEDGGVNWQQAGDGLISFNGVANLGIDPGDSNTLYAIIWPKYAGSYLRRGAYPGLWEMMPTPNDNSQIDTGMTIDGGTGALYVMVWAWPDSHRQLWRTLDPKVPNVDDVVWEMVHDFGSDVWVDVLASGAGPGGLQLYAEIRTVTQLGGSSIDVGPPVLYHSPDGGKTWNPLPLSLSESTE